MSTHTEMLAVFLVVVLGSVVLAWLLMAAIS